MRFIESGSFGDHCSYQYVHQNIPIRPQLSRNKIIIWCPLLAVRRRLLLCLQASLRGHWRLVCIHHLYLVLLWRVTTQSGL